ncbi:MAG: hypothetical protein PUB42_03340 [Firmicutes bacterium]|nr:hypothetical protein [Bacillota bacterium]
MKKNCITVYHKVGGGYVKSIYNGVRIRYIDKIKSEGGGIAGNDLVTVRIFGKKPILVSSADKAVLGKCQSAVPPKTAMTVTAVYDNICAAASAKHYRICLG